MDVDWLDDDGYPTEEACERVKNWQLKDGIIPWSDFVKALWRYPHYWTEYCDESGRKTVERDIEADEEAWISQIERQKREIERTREAYFDQRDRHVFYRKKYDEMKWIAGIMFGLNILCYLGWCFIPKFWH